jgi:hypothetical protein
LILRCWSCLGALALSPAAFVGATETSGRCGAFDFADVTQEVGVEFMHESGAAGDKHLVETMGGGLAWLDYDHDGWMDLYLVQSGPFPPDGSPAAANRLFRNLDGERFVDVTDRSGTGDRGCGQGVLAGDVDGDGQIDLYVTNFGRDVLLHNDGQGGFENRTVASGLGLDGWSSSAALADADGDRDLDLYVTRYVQYDVEADIFCGDPQTGEKRYCDPSIYLGASDRFYRNSGSGVFVDASAAAGILPADGRGLGVVFLDLDDDGHPDLYVANDLNINLLVHNRGDGTFEDVSLFSGIGVNRDGRPEAGMGLAVGDVDGDLDPDLAVTNFDVETNTLYRNLGAMSFEDVSSASGFGLPSFNQLAFGIAAFDGDQDADLDFYISNGHIFEHPKRDNVSYRQRDQVLLGDGAGNFSELRCPQLDERQTVGRGLAVADFDNDGDADLGLQTCGGPFSLLGNRADGTEWLGLIPHGRSPNSEGVGLRAILRSSGTAQVRWVYAGDSYQSSSDRRLLFALPVGDSVQSVELTWPSGRHQRFRGLASGRYIHFQEPQ